MNHPGASAPHAAAPAPAGEPVLITAAELAAMMHVSVRTVWRLLSAGQLVRPIRLGGATRWRLEEVRQWIDQGCPAPSCTQQ